MLTSDELGFFIYMSEQESEEDEEEEEEEQKTSYI